MGVGRVVQVHVGLCGHSYVVTYDRRHVQRGWGETREIRRVPRAYTRNFLELKRRAPTGLFFGRFRSIFFPNDTGAAYRGGHAR